MNAKGMATIGFLVLMPLLAAVLAFMASAYLMIRTDGRSRHACRTELLKSQNEVALVLKDLLKLNTQAKRLRAKRARADHSEKLARQTPAHPLALIYLAKVQVEQASLALKQKMLILEGQLKSKRGPIPASRAIQTAVAGDALIYNHAAMDIGSRSTTRGGSFQLTADPVHSLTPSYQPARGFELTQTMEVKWQVALGPLLPNWIKNFISIEHLKLSAECSATLTKEKNLWVPVLSAGKS